VGVAAKSHRRDEAGAGDPVKILSERMNVNVVTWEDDPKAFDDNHALPATYNMIRIG
jgi:hypothetical protein